MSRRKTFRGATLDEALSAACGGLGSRLEELHYEVVAGEGGDVDIEAAVDPESSTSTPISSIAKRR